MAGAQRVQTGFRLLTVFGVLLAAVCSPVTAVTEAEGRAALEATQVGFRAIRAQLMPAVVSISSRIETPGEEGPLDALGGGASRTRTAAGSGVIIRNDGVVLTNSHVVEDATTVTVTLANTDKALPAEVVQADPRTDLAIVRIKETGPFPTAPLGDATTVQVGDWAVAFGNPFRLPSTMTVGVISATGRSLRGPESDYSFSDLLQTDASINPGNSGGPLVNIKGEVIGVNFMIYSPGDTGGSVGIGFAIPINDYTKDIINTLAQGKPYERGRLGVSVRNLTDAMRELYGVKDGGVMVDEVMPNLSGDRGGLKPQDVIVQYNGAQITDVDQFVRMVERSKPGTVVRVVVIRDKKTVNLDITVGAAPVAGTYSSSEKKTGMSVTTLTQELAAALGIRVNAGVVIRKVAKDSAAEQIGLRAGDVILRVGRQDVRTVEDFWATLSKEMEGAKLGVVLRVQRGRLVDYVTLPPVGM